MYEIVGLLELSGSFLISVEGVTGVSIRVVTGVAVKGLQAEGVVLHLESESVLQHLALRFEDKSVVGTGDLLTTPDQSAKV